MARCSNAARSKFAPSSRLMRLSMLRLKRAVTPLLSLYARSRIALSFFRSTPISSAPPWQATCGHVFQQRDGLVRVEVADGGAGEVDQVALGRVTSGWGRSNGLGEVRAHRADLQVRIVCGEPVGAASSRCSLRDVDRHVGGQVVRGRRAAGGSSGSMPLPSSISDASGPISDGHLVDVVAHDRELGARGVVLGQLGDLVEELRAVLVVEVLRRQRLLRLPTGRRAPRRESRPCSGAGREARCGFNVSVGQCDVLGQPDAAELPARVGIEEVAVGGADVGARRGAGAAAQHDLVAHELAVVLAERAGRRREARVGRRRRWGSTPRRRQQLLQAAALAACCATGWKRPLSTKSSPSGRDRRRRVPLGLGGQARAGPAGVGVGLVEADVADRGVVVERLRARQRERGVQSSSCQYSGRCQSLLVDRGPAVGQPQLGAVVAAVVDEGSWYSPFVTGRLASAWGRMQHLVARPLVVEGEAVAGVADLGRCRRARRRTPARAARSPRSAAACRGRPAAAGCAPARA